MKDVHVRTHTLKKGKKSYEYRFEKCPVNGDRKWGTKSGFKSKAEALQAGRLAQQEYWNGRQAMVASDISFADYLDLWMEQDCKTDLKDTTIHNYNKRIKNHIKPALGDYPLRGIRKENLQAFVLDMYDAGYSRNTLSSVVGILSKSMNYAVDHHYLVYSPAVRLKIPKNRMPTVPTRTKGRVVIPEEKMREIFARFPETHPSHIPLRLGYECGLRISEAYAITWEDVDLEKQTISINRQVQWHKDESRTRAEKLAANGKADAGNGFWYFANPKFDSIRTVTVSDKLTEVLQREKKRQMQMREYYGEHYITYYSEYELFHDGRKVTNPIPVNAIREGGGNYPVNIVCVRDNGTYISSRTMQYPSSIIQKSIFSEFDFHSLRHTHASILYGAGLSVKYVSERLGHKDYKVTTAVYIHLTDNVLKEGSEKVNAIFSGMDY